LKSRVRGRYLGHRHRWKEAPAGIAEVRDSPITSAESPIYSHVSSDTSKRTDLSESSRQVSVGGIGTNLGTRTAFPGNAIIDVSENGAQRTILDYQLVGSDQRVSPKSVFIFVVQILCLNESRRPCSNNRPTPSFALFSFIAICSQFPLVMVTLLNQFAYWLVAKFVTATPKCVVETYVLYFLDSEGVELEFLTTLMPTTLSQEMP
jgi:hypothetical protein